MDIASDDDAEVVADRVVARMRTLLAGLPLRAAFVESLGIEVRPAVHALLFALSTERADDTTSLEHHETTAMIALLGRSFALDGTTPTAAVGVVPAFLEAFRREGFTVPASLDSPLASVFLEGFVRGREEKVRAESTSRALEAIALVRILPRIGLVIVRGAHDPDHLGGRLESIAREAFAFDLGACIVDIGPSELDEGILGALLHFTGLLASVGVTAIVAGTSSEPYSSRGRATRASTLEAFELALGGEGLAVREDRRLRGSLRELLRNPRGARRR